MVFNSPCLTDKKELISTMRNGSGLELLFTRFKDVAVQSSSLGEDFFMLELQDLPHQINQTVNEVVKEAVQTALQAPLHERFRDLSKAEMKEILHQRMFESGTYQSQPEHVALYEDLKASMDHDNRDELLEATAKSRKRVWKTSDTREAPSSSSKQKFVPHSEQPIEEVPIPDENILDSEDTDTAHLPKIKTKPDWLKSIPEEDKLETLEPDWVIPPNDLPEPENSWANAFANSYQDPEENKILQKTGDMSSFIKWYCRQIEKSKLNKSDLEGPAFKGNRLVPDVGKPLPLGGPPGQVTIQPQFFFNKDLEYLVSGNQERRNALSISKLKALTSMTLNRVNTFAVRITMMIADIEECRHRPSDAMHNPP
ncbi:hypothetical protein Tco_0008008 [Tanacetum coccineum]